MDNRQSLPRLLTRKAGTALRNPEVIWPKTRSWCAEQWDKLVEGRTWVHFLHIGKTGGTALKSAVSKAGNSPQSGVAVTFRKLSPRTESVYTPSHRIFLHPHNISLKDIPKGEKFFFFLRDPIDRFVSGFYSRKRKGQPRYYSPWRDSEKKAFERYQTPNELALALSSNTEEERQAAVRAMRSIEHVRDSYSKWYESRQYFLSRLSDAMLVGRVEELDSHFSQLRKDLSLSPRSSLPTSDEKAHKNPYPEVDTRLTEQARRSLRDWYQEDYAFLELCEKHSDKLRYPA